MKVKSTLKCAAVATALVMASCSSAPTEADLPVAEEIKSIPLPPSGMRWVVNEGYTDEFNGTELDDTKWLDHHPTWKGRAPGLFQPSNVKVADGYLQLHGEKMDKPVDIKGTEFTISCAAVTSIVQEAHYGYYECRFKANQATLSSTFWFSTRGKSFSTEGRQPEGAVEGTFSQELDVCECIGRSGDFDGKFFADGMNSNVHYWFNPKNGERQDLRIEETRLRRPDGAKPTEDFNVYGCWWRDENSASFYLNNEQQTDREFKAREGWGKPYDLDFNFTEPMAMNLVVETYPFPWIPLPTDEELADPTKNTTLYDYVRAYVLVDASSASEAGISPYDMFDDCLYIADKGSVSLAGGELNLNVQYTAPVDRMIRVDVFTPESRKAVKSIDVAAPAGYANLDIAESVSGLTAGAEYCVAAYLYPADDKFSRTSYLSGDSFSVAK